MEITLYCKGKLNSPPRKKRERRHVGYVAQWPGQEADAALKSSCKKLPRTWEETEEWQHDHSSLQDSTELADQRRGKGSKRQQTFFFFHRENYCNSWSVRLLLPERGKLTNLSTPATSPPLLPNHLLSLAHTQWCSSDWNSPDPSSLFLPYPWTECGCRQGLKSIGAARHKRSARSMHQKQEGGDSRDFLLSATDSTRFNQVTSCDFKLFGTTQAFRI